MTNTGQVISSAIVFIKFLTLLVLSGLQVFKRNQKAVRKRKTLTSLKTLYLQKGNYICCHVQNWPSDRVREKKMKIVQDKKLIVRIIVRIIVRVNSLKIV